MATIPITRERSVSWRIATDTLTVGFWTGMAELAGALKVAVMARFFGASRRRAAFPIAFLFPSFIADVIAGSFTPSAVPVFVQARAMLDKVAAGRLYRSALGMSVAAACAVGILVALGSPWLIPLFGRSLSTGSLRLASRIFLLLLLWLPLSGCIA